MGKIKMGLFKSKQQPDEKSHAETAADEAVLVFDEKYRDELRALGRDYFTQVMDESVVHFKQDLDMTVDVATSDLKQYMTQQLDATLASVNTAITAQLQERLKESDRMTKDAQDLAVQSLNRNAQVLHDKYQQLSQTLQQALASQEAMMIGVFEENKARMMATQNAQETIFKSLRDSANTSRQESQQLSVSLQKTISEQETMLGSVFAESMARVNSTKDAQDLALQSLNQSAGALKQQYETLTTTLQQKVAEQETVIIDAFQENMAQVVEHYLLGALGDQFDIKAQLPMIIQQMETNKQAIADDMKL